MTEPNEKNKIEITLPIKVERTSKSRRKAVASVLDLPEDKQPDLMYFSGIMVSSGENLNHAYFLPSELIKAETSIINKAIDKEHKEDAVIGHIYDRAFLDKDGNALDITELAGQLENATLEKLDMDVLIAGIIYKARFPEEAEEVKNGEWSLSMEAYFKDYDVKVGDLLIPRKDAEALGLTEASIGKEAIIKEEGKEVASGPITRVLRDIVFAGCGIVKNPANPASVFLEAAALKNTEEDVIELKNINEIVSEDAEVEIVDTEVDEKTKKEDENVEDAGDWVAQPTPTNDLKGDDPHHDTVGQCIHFRRFAEDAGEGASDDWCGLYGQVCTSQYREQRDPDCLRYREFVDEMKGLVNQVVAELEATKEQVAKEEFLAKLKLALKDAIDKAAKHGDMPPKKKKKKKKKNRKKNKTSY